ncbi:apoptosis-associated speck-like protein containing a CARD isoform X1 [Melanotaenia boesemani]|uniref:apoptosis-associated speck-like protein containing a CARD isoform X1 n=1 Tax=Melanotaenia boesemani TaxID=1250792 RepID=UPI001C05A7B4|nr:apoptosis-associated speck-like protein containing a CARD isoform X1 [Melanotaenia boesemani]XP_041843918.1 apoptosis-associated speck-like protein containing a CARD isoform X1 [Melanotaenia boesemani]
MPPKSIRKCLDGILGSLSKENFDKFVHELVQRQQEPRVLRNRVEGERYWQVVEVMIQTFTENTAVDVAMELLEEIDLSCEAEELGKSARSCGYKPTSGPSDAGAAGPPPAAAGGPPPERHFVDTHRTALIQDLSLVDPILDVLRGEGVINPEMYSNIRAERTPQNKMRKLFEYLDAMGEEGKDVFLSALKDQQPFLYNKLCSSAQVSK